MEKTDAVVATVADKLGDKALQYLQSFEELAKQYSPDVVDAGLTVIRVHGIKSIVECLVGIAIGAAFCLAAYKLYPIIEEKVDESMASIFSTISGIIGTIVLAVASISIFNVWTWVAVFDPKLYLAYKIFGKLF